MPEMQHSKLEDVSQAKRMLSEQREYIMKYNVRGTIELNWQVTVEADSEEEAEEKAKLYAEDGIGLGIPVDRPEVDEIETQS